MDGMTMLQLRADGRTDGRGQPTTAVEAVVARLQREIVLGERPAGALLPPERELAAQLDVSRATLREALSILAQKGLLVTRRGRNGGAVVSSPGPATVSSSVALLYRTRGVTARQLAEFRRALEVQAAQLAAARRSEAALRRIEAACDRYLAAVGQPDENALGRAFHYAVAVASDNPLLAETMYSLNEAFAECLGLQLQFAARMSAEAARLHPPIVAAIRARDVAAARRAMDVHFDQLDALLAEAGLDERRLGGPGADIDVTGVAGGGDGAAMEVPFEAVGRAR
jgi:GntR family transcriptional regulator, transcriptional repressor for pyruvate dehydrogenase complex